MSLLGTEVGLFGMQTSGRKFTKKKKGGGQYLETRQMKKILSKSPPQILVKKFKLSEQVTLIHSICQKHNLDPTIFIN